MKLEEKLKEKYKILLPRLDEKQKRLVLAADACSIGYKGVSIVSGASGISRPTIMIGKKDLVSEESSDEQSARRIRKIGGGRKKISEINPEIISKVERMVDPLTRGDPMSPLRWTCKSTRNIAKALSEQGYKISHVLVGIILHNLDYSLQGNAKIKEGSDHPDRDRQFNYINETVTRYLKNGDPVISVDCKKKENIGTYKNNGKEWQPQGNPVEVNIYDFPDKEKGKALPYGVYDIGKNLGWVNVGCDHDTSAFAVESIRRWYKMMGSSLYNDSKKLLICADGGGSNGYRVRLWKVELQKLADEIGYEITVCHFPPGTSKWNKIEHRLFSQITKNWRGEPLISHEVVVNLIGSVKTDKGLSVKACLDLGHYPTKVKVSDEEIKNVNLYPHEFHGEWNYTINTN